MDDFHSMTVAQLKDIARQNNLKNWSKLKKADLIQFLVDNIGGRRRCPSPRRRSPSPPPRRSPSPRRRSPSPPPRRSPSPRRRSPSPPPRRSPSPRLGTPNRGRPRSRRGSPVRVPSGPFGVAKLKKRQCDRNLRKDVVAVAEDYGIAITKPGGKKKTIKELCVEIDVFAHQPPPMPVPAIPPRTRTPSPVGPTIGMARPPTPPIIDDIPEGVVPREIVYSLTNIDREMSIDEFLMPKVVTRPQLVRYAQELGIKGKSLTKPVLLNRIIGESMKNNRHVVAQAIKNESSVIAEEIRDRVFERVEASGEVTPTDEEIQVVVEQRVSTGEPVNAEAVANEIVAEQQSDARSSSSRSSRSSSTRPSSISSRSSSTRPSSISSRSSSTRPSSRSSRSSSTRPSSRSSRSSSTRPSSRSSRSSSTRPSSRSSRSSSTRPSSRSSRSSSRPSSTYSSSRPSSTYSSSRPSSTYSSSRPSSTRPSLSSRSGSSMSASARSSVASSVSVASAISNKVAEAIVDEVTDRTDRSSVQKTIKEVVEEQGVNLDIDPDRLEEVISDEQAREAIEIVVSKAEEEGLISSDEGEEILQPLREHVPAAPPRTASPRAASPRTASPRAASPRATPPRAASPRATPPRAASPRAASPRATPPRAASPRAASPRAAIDRPTGTRPKVSPQRKPSRSGQRRQIRDERDIERMLREIQKPDESISNMSSIQNTVFRCLGLVN